MAESIDIDAKLNRLTARQCIVLYWFCQGSQFAEIAQKINFSARTVQEEMENIYHLFELDELNREGKRAFVLTRV